MSLLSSVVTFVEESRKAVTTAVGVTVTVLTAVNTLPFIPASVHGVVTGALAVATVLATYLIPNKPPAS